MAQSDVNESSSGVVVTLKRKVRSLETNLLEWRRCACTLTRDGQLVLELSDDDVDDVVLGDGDNEDAERHSSADQQQQLRGDVSAIAHGDESRLGKCRVAIDLSTQLRSLEQKRKHKTRCELAYALRPPSVAPLPSSHGGLVVRTEELMASPAKHCQQFIDSVREAERHAKRKHSMRIGALLAVSSGGSESQRAYMKEDDEETRLLLKNAAAQRRGVQSTHAASGSSFGGKQDEVSQPSVAATTPQHRDSSQVPNSAIFSFAAAAASFSSSTGSEFAAGRPSSHPQRSSSDQNAKYWPPAVDRACESDTLDTSNVSEPLAPITVNPTLSARSSRVTASPMSNSFSNSTGTRSDSVVLSSKPLPADLFAKRLAAIRLGARDGVAAASDSYDRLDERDLASDDEDNDDDGDDADRFGRRRVRVAASPRIRATPRIALPRRAHTGPTARRPSVGNNRTASTRFSAPTRAPASSRRRTSCASSTTTSAAATLAANLYRLRRRDDAIPATAYVDGDDDNGSDSNRAELHILMRVEAALRQLEKENAAAKEREHVFTQEVHALRDALRVKSAEKKHVDAQFRDVAREKHEWQQVAQ